MSDNNTDITGARARRRMLIGGAIAFLLIVPWFFSPWRTLFFYAIKSNKTGLVGLMLSLGTDANKAEPRGVDDFHADTPLVAAIKGRCSSPEIVQLLLDHHADPNHRAGRRNRCTPLSYLGPLCPDAVAIAKLLVAAGAKINACSCTSSLSDRMAEPLLSYQESVDLAKYFLDQGADPNKICAPEDRPAVDTVGSELKALYFEHGAKVVPDPKTGKTMLHRFAEAGTGVGDRDTGYRLPDAELALKHGADVNAVDATGRTPMDYALRENDEAMVELLSKHGGHSKKEEGFQDGQSAQESADEYSSFRTFAGNVHKAQGCSFNLHGENRAIMEEGVNLAVVKGTVATARVRCPAAGYLHWAVLGMGPPIPKQINIPLQAGLTSAQVTFDKTWLNGEMHWYYTRGRVPNLLHSITRGEVRQIAVRYINVADAN